MSIIRILSTLLLGAYGFLSQAQSTIEIRVNLQGYPSDMPKKALILSKGALDNPVMILKDEKGEILEEYKCLPNEKSWHPFSHNYISDFSDFQKRGKYYIELKGSKIASQPFIIGAYPKR